MNYHKICKEILTNLNYTPKILLHSCCAPCSSQVITLLTEYFDKFDLILSKLFSTNFKVLCDTQAEALTVDFVLVSKV